MNDARKTELLIGLVTGLCDERGVEGPTGAVTKPCCGMI